MNSIQKRIPEAEAAEPERVLPVRTAADDLADWKKYHHAEWNKMWSIAWGLGDDDFNNQLICDIAVERLNFYAAFAPKGYTKKLDKQLKKWSKRIQFNGRPMNEPSKK